MPNLKVCKDYWNLGPGIYLGPGSFFGCFFWFLGLGSCDLFFGSFFGFLEFGLWNFFKIVFAPHAQSCSHAAVTIFCGAIRLRSPRVDC